MTIPDINLLVYAYSEDAPHHKIAREWFESIANSGVEIGIPWAVATGYVRIMTHPRVLVRPISPGEAIADVRSWFEVPQINPVDPGPRHLDILGSLLSSTGVGASLTTDAHLAAIAIEFQAEIHSNDADFARFPGLHWVNPIK